MAMDKSEYHQRLREEIELERRSFKRIVSVTLLVCIVLTACFAYKLIFGA